MITDKFYANIIGRSGSKRSPTFRRPRHLYGWGRTMDKFNWLHNALCPAAAKVDTELLVRRWPCAPPGRHPYTTWFLTVPISFVVFRRPLANAPLLPHLRSMETLKYPGKHRLGGTTLRIGKCSFVVLPGNPKNTYWNWTKINKNHP